MRIGYFDCFSGASGDMILAAMLSVGLSEERLRSELGKLSLGGYELSVRQIQKQGLAAVKVDVVLTDKPGHRHLNQIIEIIDRSALSDAVKHRAKRIFTRLGEAEAKVHGIAVETVHFHEVGAIDAIVDVVGAAIGWEQLGLERVLCSPIPVGSGTVRCEHGVLPVPAPATAELLAGVPLAECEETGELLTPTGAAILTALVDGFGPIPAMQIERCGYGAGSRDGQKRPNVLRLFVGQAAEAGDLSDEVVVLEANLDDTTGEQIGHSFAALLAAGALDVFTTPIMMKKNRPGVTLSVLATRETQAACEEVLFAETTTLGVRRHVCSRRKLARDSATVETKFGPIRMKLGKRGDHVTSASPEYEVCAAAAKKHGVSLREVMSEAAYVWRRGQEEGRR
ncbi:MAG TPA: nickel pincer cofactor biosynthesis protein LarC [Phycisphaerae bacterium]|nr:nickel pincer cofactor biosynthesis protein LarC [Phycisphaerae bacterium]